ncbi:MAG: hypothetical protein KAI64_07425 [Thermoplasmata archaeon]|nr:hypothetical protein [Thermoplasmata archaeon]
MEGEPRDLECYEFNTRLKSKFDDGLCDHCKKYLTLECAHIDWFIEDDHFEDEF